MAIAGRHLGRRRMLVWLVTGYTIALASEASSIRNGFPYGMYHYIYENLTGEWMLFGVPVWDSLSYPFLIYAGYAMALWCLAIPARDGSLRASLLGALFTMLLDIIIDPLTVRGDQWFLGSVYYYPNGGLYFGVPLSNFFGWFLVPLVVIAFNQLIWRQRWSAPAERVTPSPVQLGAAFYVAIAFFNIAITFWIGEWLLGVISFGWLAIPFGIRFRYFT